MREVQAVQKEIKERKPNKAKGYKLQKLANQMLAAGDTGKKYLSIRRQAEFHLGYWDWQTQGPNFGKTQTRMWRNQADALFPYACVKAECPNLPAGSADCMFCEECP